MKIETPQSACKCINNMTNCSTFFNILTRELKGRIPSNKAKRLMADAIKNIFRIDHEYLIMLMEIQQNLN